MQTRTQSSSGQCLAQGKLIPIAFSLLVFISGCATSAPNFGDSVASEGDQYNAISSKWAEGQKLLLKGERRIEKGQEQIRDGNENVSEGEAMVRRGRRLMTESEEEYKLKKEF